MPHRRTVLKAVAGASLMSAASLGRVLGANDRVRVGLIGHGLIGTRHLLDFKAQPDVEIVGVSELSDARLEAAAAAAGNGPARYKDFRKLLDRQDLDAVVVSTPDHWHALMTILACAAGKDVYVEKPLTHVLREGEWMQQAAAAHKRVVQVGTQQRSGRHYARCAELVRAGHIGEVHSVRMSAYRNILPGFSKAIGDLLSAPDWDMWLGPAPFVPFDPGRCLYHFRWFWDYSGGQTTNLLAHHIDIVQWMMGKAPLRVSAMGARYELQGIGETPDVFEAILEYPGFLATWSSRELAAAGEDGLVFYGTRGTLTLSRAGFEIVPERAISPEDQIPRFSGPRPVAGGAYAPDHAVEGRRLRPGARPVRAPRPQLRRLREVARDAGLRPGEQPSQQRAVPSREHLDEARPHAAAGTSRSRTSSPTPRRRGFSPRNTAVPGTASCARRFPVREPRRGFLRVLGASALGLAALPRLVLGAERGYGIAFTSFAVRLQRGRDLIRGAGPIGLPAEALVELCHSFGADGCQLDIGQLDSTKPDYLDGLKRKLGEAGLFVELAVPGKVFEDESYFADVARVARGLGAARLRVALLHGRRYEDFGTLEAWRMFADHWRETLPRAKRALDQNRLEVGIENHKDWLADELVELIRSVDSPYLGACVDFGNNISLLEDPLDTVTRLAPYAMTTHLKDMALRPYEGGFELSEVPLGTGMCPLAKMIEVLRTARPKLPLCLEMITRDPLKVPYRDDGYWASFGGRDEARIAAFETRVLSRARKEPLPRVSGSSLEAMQAQEDENVRLSTAFARDTLHL